MPRHYPPHYLDSQAKRLWRICWGLLSSHIVVAVPICFYTLIYLLRKNKINKLSAAHAFTSSSRRRRFLEKKWQSESQVGIGSEEGRERENGSGEWGKSTLVTYDGSEESSLLHAEKEEAYQQRRCRSRHTKFSFILEQTKRGGEGEGGASSVTRGQTSKNLDSYVYIFSVFSYVIHRIRRMFHAHKMRSKSSSGIL